MTFELSSLAGRRVLVVGDLCLDEYLIGRAARLSREAPVPVLEFLRQIDVPGAAANPAINVAALGGEARLAGVVGDDPAGRRLIRRLTELGVRTDLVRVDPARPTTVKTRILAEVSLHFPQQIVRLDRQDRSPLSPATQTELIGRIAGCLAEVDAVLISDYRAGVVDPALVAVIAAGPARLRTADSQGDLSKFAGFDAVKANQEETEAFLGRRLAGDAEFAAAGAQLCRDLKLASVLITRGRDGMTLVEAAGGPRHIPPANASEVFDVTGAGDTVIAAYTLAIAGGARPEQAAHLANVAAGLVVRRLGNHAPTPDEIRAAWRDPA